MFIMYNTVFFKKNFNLKSVFKVILITGDLGYVKTSSQATLILSYIYSYTSNLSKAHETRDSLSSCCLQVVQVYLQPCRRNSLMKCAPQPKIAKNTKTYFESTRSFKVIDVDTVQKLVTSACSGKQYICIHLQPFLR